MKPFSVAEAIINYLISKVHGLRHCVVVLRKRSAALAIFLSSTWLWWVIFGKLSAHFTPRPEKAQIKPSFWPISPQMPRLPGRGTGSYPAFRRARVS